LVRSFVREKAIGRGDAIGPGTLRRRLLFGFSLGSHLSDDLRHTVQPILAAVMFLVLSKRDPFLGLNAGFVALCFNFLITAILSLLTPSRVSVVPKPLAGLV
jgi:hypothetical protein